MEIVALVAAIAAIAAYAIAGVLDNFSSSSSWEAAPCSYWHINSQSPKHVGQNFSSNKRLSSC
jgi:hypothetical protein